MTGKSIFPVVLLIFGLACCKKENVTPATPDQLPALDDKLKLTYNNYPDNFLKPGNYWIYSLQDFSSNPNDLDSTVYLDSVFVEAIDLSTPGDTFYQLTHVRGSRWGEGVYMEYVKITADGTLQNKNGDVFAFADLPSVSDSVCPSFKCSWYWTGYEAKDTVAYMPAACGVMPTGIYTSQKLSHDCEGITTGAKTVYFARGIGMVRYNKYELWGSGEQRELVRFHLAM